MTDTMNQNVTDPVEELTHGQEPQNKNQLTDAKIRRSKAGRITAKVAVYVVLVFYAFIIIAPFLIILLTSFKTWRDASSLTFEWIPSEGFTAEAYAEVFRYRANMDATLPTLVRGFFNTLMYVLPPTLIGLFTSSLSAFAFSKLRFRSKKWMYTALLATMMIPGMIMVAPQFIIYDLIGWVDTPLPLMIPGMFGAAACVFFMRQFYVGIPDSILEAGKLDGLSYFGLFIQIIVPLSVPALIAQGLLGFIGGYNDYFNPLIYLQSSDLYTLQIALRTFAGVYANEQNVVMAGTLIALLPTLVIYFIAQNYFIEGIATSGVKQ